MTAYYNEHDKFAAAWLRELIKANLIAPGEVDERSITDVQPGEIAGFAQCHFFAGIGVWSYALRAAGWADDTPVWTGSCPCQSFSASGKRGGFSDERHLWPAWFRLIRECQPDTVFGEQVASKDGLAWLDVVSADLENEEYAFGAIDTCAAGFGAPNVRQRLYWVANPENAIGRRSDRAQNEGRRTAEIGRPSLRGGLAHPASGSAERGRAQRNERAIQDSYWAGNEWVETSDGRKFPIKPGLCVLAHGATNRVGRLRGYGNALNAEQAKGFIEAYIETCGRVAAPKQVSLTSNSKGE